MGVERRRDSDHRRDCRMVEGKRVMADNFNVRRFFEGFTTPSADIRILVGYDSMCSESQTLHQGSMMRSIIETWDFPNQTDGSSPWVSVGTQGNPTFGRTIFAPDASTNGWTRTNNKAPGGAASVSGEGLGGPASGGETGVSPNPYADWTIAAGTSRTAYGGDGSGNGLCMINFLWNPNPSGSNNTGRPLTFNGYCDPFSGVQCHARMLFTKNTAGPTDMRVQGVRQLWSSLNTTSANTGYIGSKTTIDMSGSGYSSVDVDCGTGHGEPGFVLVNPNTPTGASTLRMYVTGARVYRSSGGLPLTTGVHIATMAQGANSDIHQASLLGVADMTTGQSNANSRTPNPYCAAADTRSYIASLVGGSTASTGYPNRIIIYTGHNLSDAETSELASGQSATMLAALTGIMTQHTANAAALNSEVPRFLIVSCEKFYTGYSATIRENKRNTARAAAGAFGANASFIDLYDYTNDGTADSVPMWYCRARSAQAVTGTSSGPIVDPSPDYVHNSYAGANYIARLVWEIGMESLGKLTNQLRTTRTTFTAKGKTGWRARPGVR
jgi:hypothetical protein